MFYIITIICFGFGLTKNTFKRPPWDKLRWTFLRPNQLILINESRKVIGSFITNEESGVAAVMLG